MYTDPVPRGLQQAGAWVGAARRPRGTGSVGDGVGEGARAQTHEHKRVGAHTQTSSHARVRIHKHPRPAGNGEHGTVRVTQQPTELVGGAPLCVNHLKYLIGAGA